MLTAEQILATNKAHVETMIGLSTKAFEGAEKLLELNLAASRELLADTTNQSKELLNVKDAQELLAIQSGLLQPLAEKASGYSRQMYEIAANTSAEFSKAFESQYAEAQKKFMDLVENTARNAPAGSESAVALMKNAFTTANNVLETAQKSAKQAASLAETNFKAATASATEASKASTKKRA